MLPCSQLQVEPTACLIRVLAFCPGGEDPLRWDRGCGGSLSIHLNPSLFVGQAGNTQLSLSPSQRTAHYPSSSSLFFFCLLWILTGVSAFAVHPKTREHIQTQQQRHGQRQSEREDDGGYPHQRDRPGQPGPKAHKRRRCQGESDTELLTFRSIFGFKYAFFVYHCS